MKIPKITKESLPQIKEIVMEYSKHDVEAFQTRTELFKIIVALTKTLYKCFYLIELYYNGTPVGDAQAMKKYQEELRKSLKELGL